MVDVQRKIRGSNRQIEIVREIIREKLRASVITLRNSIPNTKKTEDAICQVKKWIIQLEDPKLAKSIPQILGIEGPAARAYFQAWEGIPLNWTGLSRKPIPRDWQKIGPRMMSWRKRARAARHPINAMLNYGYALLKAQVRSELSAAGFDPSLGLMHGNSSSSLPLVYDFMEPLRPVIDARILQFAFANTFTPDDFTINRIGACRLHPQLARKVVQHCGIGTERENGALSRLLTY